MVVQENTPSKLHIFCDASSITYGAVAYLVGERTSYLVTSNARVAPMKTRTLPQMELTALQVGTHLANHLRRTLNININSKVIWSDNEAALQWIRNDNCKIPFIEIESPI